MKPIVHAQNSVKKWKGKAGDYLRIHNWLDQTKAHFPSMVHRAILHNSFGIFLCEEFFGVTITNSDGEEVSVKDIAEAHIIEDLGFIPTIQDYLNLLPYQEWMSGKGYPDGHPGKQQLPGTNASKVLFDVRPYTKSIESRPFDPSSTLID